MKRNYISLFTIGILFLITASSQFFMTNAADTSSNNVACTQEYAPVCGQPKSPTCTGTSEVFCLQNALAPKTYSNTCTLNAAGATFLYKGECKSVTTSCPQYSVPDLKSNCSIEWITDTNGCKKPKITCEDTSKKTCTQEYAPVCGETKNICCGASGSGTALPSYCQNVKVSCDAIQKTFSNKCMLEAAGAKYVADGECKKTIVCPMVSPIANPPSGCQIEWVTDNNGCKTTKLVCETNGSGSTDGITKKVNEVMSAFFKKVDSLSNSDEKLSVLNSVYEKLKAKSGNLSTTGQKILDYMLSRIQEKIAKINSEGSSEINDLLKILQ